MGSKRARPWNVQPSGSSGSSAVAVATAAAFALAALSVPEASALSLQYQNRCLSASPRPEPPGACTGHRRRSDGGGSATAAAESAAGRRDEQRYRRRAPALSSSSASGSSGGAAVPRGGHHDARQTLTASSPSPSCVSVFDDDQDGRSMRNSSSRGIGKLPDGGGSNGAMTMSASETSSVLPRPGENKRTVGEPPRAAHVLEPVRSGNSCRTRPRGGKFTTTTTTTATAPHTSTAAAAAAAVAATAAAAVHSRNQRKLIIEKNKSRTRHNNKKKSLNNVRMFLMERGLSQWEVRKVLPVMRRDPELVTDIAVLAARMQVGVCGFAGVRSADRRTMHITTCSTAL